MLHGVKTQERDISRRGFYIRCKKGGIYRTLANAPKKTYGGTTIIAESRTWAVGTPLARIVLDECMYDGLQLARTGRTSNA